MVVKNLLLSAFLLLPFLVSAQQDNCVFLEPLVKINFGTGIIGDRNVEELANYRHVSRTCPTDGHYTYTSYTSNCFGGDWLTLAEDHTPGDVNGNMMLVNASPRSGAFFSSTISRLKGGTTYEFSAWFMNVCRPTEKCPFPLLPNISIVLQTTSGKVVAQISTGELIRRNEPQWTRYQALFTTPAGDAPLNLIMIDNAPGGCGNDFALDDISFRECIKQKTVVKATPKPPVPVKKQAPKPLVNKPAATKPPVTKTEVTKPVETKPVVPKPEVAKPPVTKPVITQPASKKPAPVAQKKPAPKTAVNVDSNVVGRKNAPSPVASTTPASEAIARPKTSFPADSIPAVKPRRIVLAPPPPVIANRSNPIVKRLETVAGVIKVDLYDNGQIDGDTVSVYHNNVLVVSRARLSVQPITFRITIDAANPHHELVLVAHNLGSIPPNTSLMVVNAGSFRQEVFISSNEQKNAKIVFDLKE